MNTLILYTSKHGTTQKVVTYINQRFQGDLCNLCHSTPQNLDNYDLIIIGGPIYYGTLNDRLKDFIDEHMTELIKHKIALFLVCLKEEEVAADQFNHAYDNVLLEHSIADGLFAGQLPTKLSPLEKFIVMIGFDKETLSRKLNLTDVDAYIEEIESHL